jgi:hypothetical protein
MVDGWQVRPCGDGGFGVYDYHRMVVGPFGTTKQAITAAMGLPSPWREVVDNCQLDLRDGGPGSDADADRGTAPSSSKVKHRRMSPEVGIASRLRAALVPSPSPDFQASISFDVYLRLCAAKEFD